MPDCSLPKPRTQAPSKAYTIVDLATSKFLGIISLTEKGNAGELGYWLLPRHRGNGIMREAIACLIEQQNESLASVFATVDPGNASSIDLLERSGFHQAGEHIRERQTGEGIP